MDDPKQIKLVNAILWALEEKRPADWTMAQHVLSKHYVLAAFKDLTRFD